MCKHLWPVEMVQDPDVREGAPGAQPVHRGRAESELLGGLAHRQEPVLRARSTGSWFAVPPGSCPLAWWVYLFS